MSSTARSASTACALAGVVLGHRAVVVLAGGGRVEADRVIQLVVRLHDRLLREHALQPHAHPGGEQRDVAVGDVHDVLADDLHAGRVLLQAVAGQLQQPRPRGLLLRRLRRQRQRLVQCRAGRDEHPVALVVDVRARPGRPRACRPASSPRRGTRCRRLRRRTSRRAARPPAQSGRPSSTFSGSGSLTGGCGGPGCAAGRDGHGRREGDRHD